MIRNYSNYAAMLADTQMSNGDYAVLQTTGTVLKRINNKWVLGSVIKNDAMLSGLVSQDYTAFEVYPHDADIPVGELTVTLPGTSTTVSNAELIPENMTQMFVVRTLCPDPTKCDVIIDWGDGHVSTVKDGNYSTETNMFDAKADAKIDEAHYTFWHTYTTAGRYIVRVFGKDYFNIKTHATASSGGSVFSNLMCRVFEEDLPIASHLSNLSSFACRTPLLLYVNGSNVKYNFYTNISGIFSYDNNLVKVEEFKRLFTKANCQSAFLNCTSLTTSDMQIPDDSSYSSAGASMYEGCSSLAINISKLIPDKGFVGTYGSISKCLYNCISAEQPVKQLDVPVNTHCLLFQSCAAIASVMVPVKELQL